MMWLLQLMGTTSALNDAEIERLAAAANTLRVLAHMVRMRIVRDEMVISSERQSTYMLYQITNASMVLPVLKYARREQRT
jgi:hypothetical protein